MLLSVAGLLGLPSCTAAADPTTTSIAPASIGTTVAATMTPPTTVPVVTLPPGSVGDPAVIEAARAEALRLIEIDPSSFPPGAAEMEIPWPDTTNPDPVEALRSIWEFDEWVATTLPYDAFARLYLVEDSPAWRSAGEFIEQLWINGWIVVFDDPEGYVFEGGEVVSTEFDPVAVRYRARLSDASVRRMSDNSEVSRGAGYESRERIALMVPGPLGWRVSEIEDVAS